MKRFVFTLIVLANMLTLSSCGTFEIGLEPTATQSVTPTITPPPTLGPATATPTSAAATATPTPQLTALPTLAPSPPAQSRSGELRVAWISDGNIWLWRDNDEAKLLTHTGDVSDLCISDDGQVIAFLRGIELWAVNSDGTGERALIDVEDIAGMVESGDPGVRIHHFEWVPGTHVVAFNTRLHTEIGLVVNDDLHLADADALEHTVLLPRGEGGEFTYSPDGQQIAIVRSGTITLVDAAGGNLREALTYTPPVTYSEFQFYARPVWAADARSLRVAIPPADPLALPPQLTSIWHLQTDGGVARLIGSIAARTGSQPTFSPDLRYIAYLEQTADAAPRSSESSLMITDLDSGKTIAYAARAYSIYEWSPDSYRVAFLTDPELPQAHIGSLDGDPVPAYEEPDIAAVDVRWIDADRYLFTEIVAQGRRILLRAIGGPSSMVASVAGRTLIYDVTPYASEHTGPTGPSSTIVPPAGFKQYRDSATGISIHIPEDWVITGIVPGQQAILQSYPESKYVGGETFAPGDTKCDLTIRPTDVDVDSQVQQLKSSPMATILSEEQVILQSGEPGIRFEVDSLGHSLSLVTEVDQRVVVLTCFGELEPFDDIAVTLFSGN